MQGGHTTECRARCLRKIDGLRLSHNRTFRRHSHELRMSAEAGGESRYNLIARLEFSHVRTRCLHYA